MSRIGIIFPHQLFEQNLLALKCDTIYLVEECLYFKQFNFHKQKIAFHRASMKFYENNEQTGQDLFDGGPLTIYLLLFYDCTAFYISALPISWGLASDISIHPEALACELSAITFLKTSTYILAYCKLNVILLLLSNS